MIDDEAELQRLGYRQELKRRMSAFGNFALSFSVISILTGAITLYGYGLSLGGPIEMTVGWPVVTGMTCVVALSLAELSSAYPTAGALYHWSLRLGGERIGWLTAWLNLIGQIAVVAGVDYGLADFLRSAFGLAESRATLLTIYALLLLSHGLLNHIGIRVVTLLNEVSAWYHLLGTLILIAVLFAFAPLQSPSFLLRRFSAVAPNGELYPFGYACLVGLLQAQWTFTGYDASAHAAEETVGAQEAAPRAMVSAVWISGVAGFLLLIALTLSIGNLERAAAAPNAFMFVVDSALGHRLGSAMIYLTLIAIWFCGLSCVTSNSRMLFAFARDGGPPMAKRLAEVSHRFSTPTWSIWACVATAFLLAVWSSAFSVIVSISTIGLYASYGIPIFLQLRARRRKEAIFGPYQLGTRGPVLNTVALMWIVIISVLFVLPPNLRTGVTFAGVLAVLVPYAFLKRKLFTHTH